MLSVVVLSIIAYAGLVNDEHLLRDKSQNGEHSILGPVEEFMIWLMKSPRRSYYRWLVANQLARLARLFLIQREGHDVQRWDGSLEGSGWNPPKDVETYLMYGLRRSSADLQPSPASWGQPKIDKLDPQKAVEYLESEIGDRYHGN